MKYAVISDIHGNLEALEAVLAKTKSENVDDYICVGDIVGYNANPIECIEIMQSLNPVVIVRGNHDEYAGNNSDLSLFNKCAREAIEWTRCQLTEAQRKWLKQLKLREVKHDEDITVVHATLDSPESWGYIYDIYHAIDSFSYQTTQVCFYGHSHVPVLYKKDSSLGDVIDVFDWAGNLENKTEVIIPVETNYKYLVNVGSVGQPRNGDNRASFVIYDSSKKILKRICVEYDIAAVQRKNRSAGLPEILSLRLDAGY